MDPPPEFQAVIPLELIGLILESAFEEERLGPGGYSAAQSLAHSFLTISKSTVTFVIPYLYAHVTLSSPKQCKAFLTRPDPASYRHIKLFECQDQAFYSETLASGSAWGPPALTNPEDYARSLSSLRRRLLEQAKKETSAFEANHPLIDVQEEWKDSEGMKWEKEAMMLAKVLPQGAVWLIAPQTRLVAGLCQILRFSTIELPTNLGADGNPSLMLDILEHPTITQHLRKLRFRLIGRRGNFGLGPLHLILDRLIKAKITRKIELEVLVEAGVAREAYLLSDPGGFAHYSPRPIFQRIQKCLKTCPGVSFSLRIREDLTKKTSDGEDVDLDNNSELKLLQELFNELMVPCEDWKQRYDDGLQKLGVRPGYHWDDRFTAFVMTV